MSREGRNIFVIAFKTFIKSIQPRQFQGKLIGEDHLGNKYFEIPKSETRQKTARWFQPKGGEEQFDAKLPSEWESWLRYRRNDPPTKEEILENLKLMEVKRTKAAEINKKFGTGQKDGDTSLTFPTRNEFEQQPGKGSS